MPAARVLLLDVFSGRYMYVHNSHQLSKLLDVDTFTVQNYNYTFRKQMENRLTALILLEGKG